MTFLFCLNLDLFYYVSLVGYCQPVKIAVVELHPALKVHKLVTYPS